MEQFYFKVQKNNSVWFVTGVGKSEQEVKNRVTKSIKEGFSAWTLSNLINFNVTSSTKEDYEQGKNYDFKTKEEKEEDDYWESQFTYLIF